MPDVCKRKVCGALEIDRLKTSNETDETFKLMNRDSGDYVTENSLRPLFWKIGNH